MLTNVMTAVPLMVLGDIAAQRGEWQRQGRNGKERFRVDVERTISMASYSALIFTPVFFKVYRLQDRIFQGPSKLMNATKKAGFSWLVGGWPANTGFLILTTTLEMKVFQKKASDGRTLPQVLSTKLQDDLPRIMAGSLLWWTPINMVNFFFTPPQYRLVLASVAALVWNTFLSFVQHHVYVK